MKIGNVEVYGIIYKITNKVNGKCYIGQTVNGFKKRYEYKGEGIERVYNYHIGMKENSVYFNKHLLSSIEKYGFEVFEVIEVFDIAFSKEELNIKEKHYITLFDSFKNGYNFTTGGEGGSGHDPLSSMMEEQIIEWKRKISKANKGRYVGEKNPMYGKDWREGKTEEELLEIKRKQSESRKGEKNYWYGKNPRDYWTEEAKKNAFEKRSKASKGIKNPQSVLYRVIDLDGNEKIVCGNDIWNDHKNHKLGFLNIHRETFKKYIEPYGEINIENINTKKSNKHMKTLIEKLTPYNGWKIIRIK